MVGVNLNPSPVLRTEAWPAPETYLILEFNDE
jgi:hypothetical protein